MNSGNVKEHEKFPLVPFPLHCINKREVLGCASPPSFFRECKVWDMKHCWGSQQHLFFPDFCLVSPLYPPAFSLFPHSSTKDFQQRAAGASFWLLSPDAGGFHQKSMAAYFPQYCVFYVWTDMASTILTHSAELFPFRRASLQIAEISWGPVSNCLSHLVFNLLKSGL